VPQRVGVAIGVALLKGSTDGQGIGLENLKLTINLMYGEQASQSLDSVSGLGGRKLQGKHPCLQKGYSYVREKIVETPW